MCWTCTAVAGLRVSSGMMSEHRPGMPEQREDAQGITADARDAASRPQASPNRAVYKSGWYVCSLQVCSHVANACIYVDIMSVCL